MGYAIKVSARAIRDIGKIIRWYEEQKLHLGDEFIAALDIEYGRILRSPYIYTEILPSVRRAMLPKFPYAVLYTLRGDTLYVLSIIHLARNPHKWLN